MRTYSEIFAIREFRALFAARVTTMVGVSVMSLALGAIVFDETGSAFLTALAMFGGPLVTLVGSLTVLGASDTVGPRMALTIPLGVYAVESLIQAIPGLPWPARFVVLAIPFLVNSAFSGSVMRMLTEIVPPEALILGRSTLNLAVGAMQVAGYGLGGLLLQAISPNTLFLVSAGFCVVTIIILRVGLAERPPTQHRSRLVGRTHEVNRSLLGSPMVRPIYLSLWVPNGLIAGCEALFIPLGGISVAGYLFATSAAGMLLGDVLVGRVVAYRHRDRLVGPLRLLLALPYVTLFLNPPIPVVLVLSFVAAIGFSASVILQERLVHQTDPAIKGQVSGLAGSGLMIGQAGGAALGGLIATWLAPHTSMGLLAVASAVTTIALTPGLRRSAQRPTVEQ